MKIEIEGCDTIPKLFWHQVKARDSRTAFREKHLGICSSGQYSRIGLATSSLRCSSAVGAMCGMKSTSKPSSGMWFLRFGCGQSVPHSTRSGNSSTMRRAKGTTSR